MNSNIKIWKKIMYDRFNWNNVFVFSLILFPRWATLNWFCSVPFRKVPLAYVIDRPKLWRQIPFSWSLNELTCVENACNRYSPETIRDKDLNRLPMFEIYLKSPSIFSYWKDHRSPSSSYWPWKFLTFDKKKTTFKSNTIYFTTVFSDVLVLETMS